ncbi:hypothetical protein M409DRAFT_28164 [Zasmidium cellare ATCC 36951]|uniref:hydroxymethylglutaryl-CoA lyase n=1 Tax=Zasmidium cellare ATCC 36951 TaxID=1080233 RepID=A0A6A6C3E5_ZASCE|nr:uncharacterized protein M409DRAFT_28164 [Zasmidium cellare ATCC 36951]KAF2161433.1 hypothetical protein M409DRAFT_28164 [Zasmidium cellare ATCC 36951]
MDEKSILRNSGVRIVEVGPRDGLQNIKSAIPTLTKVELVSRLRNTGLKSIELTSMVSPRAVPQLADGRQLLADREIQGFLQDEEVRHPVLVPNMRGLERAMELGVGEVAVFVSASEGFSRTNINCSVNEGLSRSRQVAQKALEAGLSVRGYVSCIFACPFDGPTSHETVARVVKDLLDMGCYEVSLGDTLGVGSAVDVKSLLGHLQRSGVPIDRLAGHFHDTYGQAVSNVWAAYECGVRVFDSSVAGLGGCPYCPGAKGNAATEDVVFLFDRAGIETGVDLDQLAIVGAWISAELSMANGSRAGAALAARQGFREQPRSHKESFGKLEQEEVMSKAQKDGSRLFQAGVSLRALWQVCHLLWRSRHKLALPLGL